MSYGPFPLPLVTCEPNLPRGPIDTPLLLASSGGDPTGGEAFAAISALKRVGKPKEVAQLITWLLSDGSSYITGTTQVIDGGIYY